MVEVRLGVRLVLWTDEVVGVLDAHRQRLRRDREAGGILLGEVSSDAVLVSRATVPSEHDRRTRFGFVRRRGPAQAVVDREHLTVCLAQALDSHRDHRAHLPRDPRTGQRL